MGGIIILHIYTCCEVKFRIKISVVFVLLFIFSGFSVLAQSSKRLQRMFDEARQLHAKQDYQSAIEKSLGILARDSTFVEAHMLLADIYH